MSQVIRVKAERSYDVFVDCEWVKELQLLSQSRTRVAVLTTSDLASRVDNAISEIPGLVRIDIPEGEEAKQARTLIQLWDSFAQAGLTRSDLVVAVGGGAVTDVVGFASATWLRGIDWIAVPTTLAGMVDASVGGKTGINSPFGKNLIGSFHSPSGVLVDQLWLETLSDRDFSAGLAEVVKCGFISDSSILEIIETHNLPEIRSSRLLTSQLISLAVAVKAEVVSADFKEGFAREILNYGHTLGHAVETHSKYNLRHGEAVAIGMIFAAELANVKGLLSKEAVDRHRAILQKLALPISYDRGAWSELLPALSLDKKARGNAVRFVGLSKIGETLRIENPSDEDLFLSYERLCK